MVKIIDLCTGCVQVITNPICPNCFSRHVVIWLRDQNIPAYRMKVIKNYLRNLVIEAEESPSTTKCIICGSKKVNLCTYCFSNKAQRLVESNTNKEVRERFNEDFNTAIWRVHKF